MVDTISTRHVNDVWPIRAGLENEPGLVYFLEPGSYCVHLIVKHKGTDEILHNVAFPRELLVRFAKAWAEDMASDFITNLISRRRT